MMRSFGCDLRSFQKKISTCCTKPSHKSSSSGKQGQTHNSVSSRPVEPKCRSSIQHSRGISINHIIMADAKIQRLYRQLFADRTISPDEDDELIATLQSLTTVQDGSSSPPALTPDKLQWMRTTAFNVARNYLDDEREENVKLLKAINAVVSVRDRRSR